MIPEDIYVELKADIINKINKDLFGQDSRKFTLKEVIEHFEKVNHGFFNEIVHRIKNNIQDKIEEKLETDLKKMEENVENYFANKLDEAKNDFDRDLKKHINYRMNHYSTLDEHSLVKRYKHRLDATLEQAKVQLDPHYEALLNKTLADLEVEEKRIFEEENDEKMV